MHDVSALGLTCASCSTAITELPFQPTADRPVYCRDCNRNRTNNRGGGGFNRTPRPMNDVSGMNLKCASCGTAITELPFTPDPERPVYCRDCNKSRPRGEA